MTNDIDPITKIGIEHGCMSCGTKTDNFYFVDAHLSQKGVDSVRRNSLYCNDLKLERP